MSKLNDQPGSRVRLMIKDWLVLNTSELSWITVVTGAVIFVGVFMQ